ncbi:MAG TPA: NFACT family protein [Thermotogota bacterium]|nr:NFACT family protein [Thermotogota bacterium]HRW33943.1 NFACT family protein [Thermotogota bacterium]
MNIDGITLRVLITEFSKTLDASYLKKVQMPSSGRFYFEFSHDILFCSLLSSDCYCCLTEKKESSPSHPEGFVMLLRKYLNGGRLKSISQIGTDRMMSMELTKRDEIGDLISYKVYFEMMGRNSNLILTDESDAIIDVWKRTITQSRSLIPGVVYLPYSTQGMALCDYEHHGLEFLISQISNTSGQMKLGKFLQDQFQGFGKQNLEEIFFRLDLKKEVEISQLKDDHLLALHELLLDMVKELREETIYVYENAGQKTLISPMPLLSAIESEYQVIKLTPSKALELANGQVRIQSRLTEKKIQLQKIILKEISKIESNIDNLEKDLKESSKAGQMQLNAELIMGSIYRFDPKKNYEIIDVTDWRTGREVRIELDKKYNLSMNAQRLFKRASKLKRREEFVKKRVQKLSKRIFYLESVNEAVENIQTQQELDDIRSEMCEAGLLTKPAMQKKTKQKSHVESSPRTFKYKGFEIVVGKNNIQNDRICHSYSREEYWFHAQQIPGSHVIINSAGREVPEDVLYMAAKLAARFSKGKISTKVPVDYTKLKYVKKPKGSPPGFRIYDNFKTFVVDPIRDLDTLE